MIGILQAQDGAGMTENLQVIGRMKMSLQFIIGSSGSGKSCYAYQNIIEQAGLHPEKLFYVIVPEQFTMQTQKTLVEMSPGRGILNIDILSFERLAYRVLEEVGGDSRILLEETGKSMVLQKMVQQHGKELSYLGGQMRKAGYLDEVKSILSEFMQYDIRDSEIQEMIEDSGDRALLQMKLKDVAVLYQAFTGYLKDHYMTGEEVMDALEKALPFSEKMKNSVLLLDGYTGFTPIQMRVVGELLAVCEKVMVTVTMDADENLSMRGKPYQLFYMSRQMIHGLSELTREIETPVLLKDVGKSRFSQAPALHFLEKNIFRYRKSRDFYEVLDFYLEMIRNLHIRTYEYLGQMRASTNPLAYCEGGFYGGHLKPNEKIGKILKPMTASFGITALNELQELYNGKSIAEDGAFALEVLKYINDKVNQYKKEDGYLYAIYGTPAESLCGLQVEQFRKMYGIIEGVSDRPYVSNSFHCHVTEDVTPIEKQDLEGRFWELCNGGKIQYVRYPIGYNKEAIRTLIRRAMDLGYYEGVNLSLAYCDDCGHEELEMDVCPVCGSRNLTKIDRMNGYLSYSRVHGDTRLNEAKMAEIAERKSM